ncbi:MAG: cache domain-containing protein [Syntrophales bacterium]|jgi:cytochrome c
MKKLITIILVIGLLAGMTTFALARGTAKEAKGMLDKAVAYYKANGKDKAFAAFNDQKGQFVKEDLYIYVLDPNGVVVSHGANAKLIGQKLNDLKDSDGKKFIQAILDEAKAKGKGTMDYKWTNPTSKKVENKSTFFEKVGDMIILCGYYK